MKKVDRDTLAAMGAGVLYMNGNTVVMKGETVGNNWFIYYPPAAFEDDTDFQWKVGMDTGKRKSYWVFKSFEDISNYVDTILEKAFNGRLEVVEKQKETDSGPTEIQDSNARS